MHLGISPLASLRIYRLRSRCVALVAAVLVGAVGLVAQAPAKVLNPGPGKRVELLSRGVRGLLPVRIDVPDPGTVEDVFVVVVYKGRLPSVTLHDAMKVRLADKREVMLTPKLIDGAWGAKGSATFSALVGKTERVLVDFEVEEGSAQSVLTYVIRGDGSPGSYQAGAFVGQSGYASNETISLTLPDGDSRPKDVLLTIPVSQLAPDGTYLDFLVKAGSKQRAFRRTWGDDSGLAAACCVDTVQARLDGIDAAATIEVTIISPDTRPATGQSYVVGGILQADVSPQCLPLELVAPATACADNTVRFVGRAPGKGYSAKWDFGPGATPRTFDGTGEVFVTFDQPGRQEITIDVVGADCRSQEKHYVQVDACNASTCALEGATVIQHPAHGNGDGVVELNMCVACGSTPPYRVFYTHDGQPVETAPIDDRTPKLRDLTPGTYENIYVVDAYGCETNVTGPLTLCNGGCGPVATCPERSCVLTGFKDGTAKRAFWLHGLGLAEPRWRIADDGYANFTVTGDETAELRARIVSYEDPTKGLEVVLSLRARRSWPQWSAMGRDWKGSRERVISNQYEAWDYYELDGSYSRMTGFGSWSGSLAVSARPQDFTYGVQVGEGANDQNLSPGVSAWFSYSGSLGGRRVNGEGDVNVEGTCRVSDLRQYATPILTCAADWSVGCDAGLDNAPRPTINCGDASAYTLTYEDKEVSTRPVTIERTWTADGPAGVTTCVQRLTFTDDAPPVFTRTPDDATVSCGEMKDMQAEATDDCGGVEVTLQESRSDETCAGSYDLHRTWTATDENGNTATHKAILKIRDRTPPMFAAAPRDVVLECGDDAPTDYPSVMDDCGGVVDTDYRVTECEPGLPIYTWTAEGLDYLVEGPDPHFACPASLVAPRLSAECSDRPSQRRRWRLRNPNDFPVYVDEVRSGEAVVYEGISLPANANVFVFTPGTDGAEIAWRDAAGQTQTAAAASSPEACSLSDAETCVCVVTRAWTATDECGNAATHRQKIYFRDAEAPTVRKLPADMTYRTPEDVPAAAGVTAEDDCSDAVITLREYQIPSSDYACADAAVHYLYGAREASGPVLRINGRPFLAGDEPLVLREACDGTATLTGEIVDAARPTDRFTVALSFADRRSFDEHRAAGGSAPAQCNSAEKSAWSFYRVAAGGELSGAGALAGTTLAVSAAGGDYVQLGAGANGVNCQRGLFGNFAISASAGAYPGYAGTLQASAASVDLQGSEACAASYTVVRLYTAVDACGNKAIERQVLRVHDGAGPSFTTVPDDVELACGDPLPAEEPKASDLNDARVDLDVAETTEGDDCGRVITRVWTATDDCGNSSTASQVITVRDVDAPVITFANAALAALASGDVLVVSCSDVPALDETIATVADDCDANPSLTFADEALGAGDCGDDGFRERFRCTWTAADACGNETVFQLYVEFRDEEGPTLAEIPADVTQTCADAFPTGAPVAADNCSANVALAETTREITGDCADSYQVIRLWTATDDCGNTATATQTVTVTDGGAPALSALPQNLSLTCADALPTELPTATDDCDADVRLVETAETTPGDCPGSYELVRLFTATDNCGNVATASQVVTVSDDVAPELALVGELVAGRRDGEELVLDCVTAPTFSATDAAATDACDARVEVVYAETDARRGDCGADGFARAFTATWTATDDCGNVAAVSLAVRVTDDSAPEFANVPAAVTVSCEQRVPTDQPTVSDGCTADADLSVAETSETRPGACADGYELVRTWTATDACGNVATASQVVTVVDDVRPTLASVPESVTIGCDERAPQTLPTASDNCDEAVEVTFADDEQTGNCAASYSVVRTFTATDDCGNVATASQVITIRDLTAPVFADVPAAVSASCADGLPTDQPTATDACAGDVTLVEESQRRPGTCPDGYELVRTWTATDACGNAATVSQVVTVVDDVAPEFAEAPEATSVRCGDPLPTRRPYATDDCDADVSVAETQETRPGACANTYELVRVFTATDNCGNQATVSQVVSVVDDTAPLFAGAPANVVLGCDQELPKSVPTATDACDGQLAVTETQTVEGGACANGYVVLREFTATDACGNVAAATQVVTVEDRVAPTFAYVPGALSLSCDEAAPTTAAKATDGCDPSVVVTETEERRDGDCAGGYELVRVFTATDACGNSATAEQVITYVDDTAPAFAAVPANVSVGCDAGLPTDAPEVSDNCDAAPRVELAEEREPGACPSSYRVLRRWTATDHCGNVATVVQVVTIQDQTPPTFASVPADIALACSQALPTDVATATDVCDADVTVTEQQRTEPGGCADGYRLVRVWTATDACGNRATASQVVTVEDKEAPEFADVPAAVTLGCSDPLPSVGPAASDNCDEEVAVTEVQQVRPGACANGYEVVRTWTATDDCGNQSTASQVVTVTDALAPEFTFVPAPAAIGCDAALPTDQPDVRDACDASVALAETQDIVPGDCPGAYTVVRTWTATDACGNTATATQAVAVADDEAPVFANVPAATVVGCEGGLPTDQPSVTDACDENVSLAETQTTEPGDCPGNYTVVRRWTATDHCGNVATAEQRVAVEDLEAPSFVDFPRSLTLSCDDVLPTDPATATDACDDDVEVAETQERREGGCTGSYAVVRIFTATDDCGNAATVTQVVTFRDDVDPVFADVPADVAVACDGELPTTAPAVSDNCDDAVAIAEQQRTEPGNCPDNYRVIRTWTATDACGNTATASQIVNVSDEEDPVFAEVPAEITVECGDELPATLATATDNCDADVTVTASESPAPGACPGGYTVVRVFTATDNCGNTATASQHVNYLDTRAPTFTQVPSATTVSCDGDVPTVLAEATDVCDANVTISVAEATEPGDCGGAYTVVRTFTATDDCGNTATAEQRVAVVDTEAPTFVSVPTDVSLACEDGTPTDAAVATDNCDTQVTVTEDSRVEPGQCAGESVTVRRWTATDHCGNTATAEQRVRFADAAGPTLVAVPAPVTIGCGQAVPTDMPVGRDGCDTDVAVAAAATSEPGDCPGSELVTRVFTATDDCGNVSTATQLVTVADREPPRFDSVPASVTVACDAPLPQNAPTALDACDPRVSVAETQEIVPGLCGGSYRVIRRWTATDACGNAATVSQVVRVQDLSKPTFVSVPPDATLSCADPLPADLPTATDVCDADVHVAETQQRLPGGCADSYTLIRKFTATDACGNVATAEQRLTISDAGGPTLAGVPADVSIGCAEALPTAQPTATDACDDDVAISEAQETVAGDCPGSYVVIRTWTAADDCGNLATGTQAVTVRDDAAPTFAEVPADARLACGEAVPTDAPTATDDCDANVEIAEAQAAVPGTCGNERTVVRTWTATDDCGNVAVATQRVTFTDEQAPVLQSVPEAVVIDCNGEFPTTKPRVTDGCGGEVTLTERTDRDRGQCADGYVVTRIWTATDVCGNTATASQVVTVEDQIAPVFAGVPAPVTITCGASLPTADPTATDNCDDGIRVKESQRQIDGACASNYEIVRTWTAVDDCGNEATASQVITVLDPVSPTFTSVPAAVTVTCAEGLPDDQPRASDNCAKDVAIEESQETRQGACPDTYEVVRTWIVSDGCGNAARATQLVTVVDREAPTFAKVPPSRTIGCGEEPRDEAPVASDGCDADVQVVMTEATLGDDCAAGIQVVRTWTATDNCGNTAAVTQRITIEDRTAPVIAGVERELRVTCDQPVPVTYPTATDVCDREVDLTYFDAERPSDCGVDIRRTWVASDDCGNTASVTQLIVVADDVRPVLAGVPASVTVGCDEPILPADVTATDNCTARVLVSATESEQAGRCAGERVITRQWSATDDCGNAVTATQRITVVATEGPVLAGVPADRSLACGDPVPADLPTATTVCGGGPGSVQVTVAEREERGGCAGGYRLVRTFTATDACGSTATASQVITFADDVAPVIANVPADVTVWCQEDAPVATPTATDACDANVRLTLAERTVAGACEHTYDVIRTWTARDACGNTATASQTVSFVDEDAPTFKDVPANATIVCGDAIPEATVRAYDGCTEEAAVNISLEEVREDVSAAGDYRLVRTWTAADACGNTATAQQVITVTATGKPRFTFVPDDLALACGEDVPDAQASAVGGCDGEAAVTLAETREPGSCANGYTLVRTWTARTSNGNTATARQRVAFSDRDEPVFTRVPADISVGCDGTVPTDVAVAVDACEGKLAVTVDEQRRPGACEGGYEVVRTFTATDACGNRATASQVVSFGDDEAPVFSSVPASEEYACSVGQPTVQARATDNCTANVRVSYEDISATADCSERLRRVWTATDACGNTATAVQQILLRDTEDPVLANVPQDVSVDLEAGRTVPSPANVRASDNCDSQPTLDFEERAEPTFGCDYVLVRTWTATDACGNRARATQRVTVTGTPDVGIRVEEPEDCAPAGIRIGVTPVDAAASYRWTATGGTLDDPTSPNPTFLPEGPGTHQVSVTVSGGACSGRATERVEVRGANLRITGGGEVCRGRRIAFAATAEAQAYRWTGPNGFTSATPEVEIPVATDDAAGTYRLRASFGDGCEVDREVVVTVVTCADDDGGDDTSDCTARPSQLAPAVAEVCLVGGYGRAEATLSTAPVVPTDYLVGYVLVGADGTILETAPTPLFALEAAGDYAIHQVVFAAATFDLATAVGQRIAELAAGFAAGGGPVCGAVDAQGASLRAVADCADDQGDGEREPLTLRREIGVSFTETLCLESLGLELTGRVTSVSDACGDRARAGQVRLAVDEATGCVAYTGLVAGVDELCVVACTADGCDSLTLVVTVAPTTPSTIDLDVFVGDAGEYCLDGSELSVPLTEVFNFCPSDGGEAVAFRVDENGNCVSYEALAEGGGRACLVLCNAIACDTTYLNVNVSAAGTPLRAIDDRAETTKDLPVDIDVVANDIIAGRLAAMTPVELPRRGRLIEVSQQILRYAPEQGFCAAVDSFTYLISDGSATDTASVHVEVTCDDLVVYSGFSPNGDGVNDAFTVLGIESYPGNEVLIFNRWGNEVYRRRDYSNAEGQAFDGRWNGKTLPSGTYYYVITLRPGDVHSGYVQLMR